jgi:hypothetical protein
MAKERMQSICLGQDGKPKLCVGHLPGRARPSLYMLDPFVIQVLASFSSVAAAEQAKRFFKGMIGSRVIDESEEDRDG